MQAPSQAKKAIAVSAFNLIPAPPTHYFSSFSALALRSRFDSNPPQESKSEVCTYEFYAAIRIKTHLDNLVSENVQTGLSFLQHHLAGIVVLWPACLDRSGPVPLPGYEVRTGVARRRPRPGGGRDRGDPQPQ